jgi:hypothetical protein
MKKVEIQFQEVTEKMETDRKFLASRIDTTHTLIDRIKVIESNNEMIQNIVLDTKKDLFNAFGKNRLEAQATEQKVKDYEMKLDRTIEDCKFWLEKYTTSFKKCDVDFKSMQRRIEGQMDLVAHEI